MVQDMKFIDTVIESIRHRGLDLNEEFGSKPSDIYRVRITFFSEEPKERVEYGRSKVTFRDNRKVTKFGLKESEWVCWCSLGLC